MWKPDIKLWMGGGGNSYDKTVVVLAYLILAFAVYKLYIVANSVYARALIPLDMIYWSESNVMNSMLKLKAGIALYSDPSDINSFVYTPAYEYINYYFLSVFGQELNIVAHRTLTILYGAFGCLLMVKATFLLANKNGEKVPKVVIWLSLLLSVLLYSQTIMFDVVNVDNLHWLITAVVFYLTALAIYHNSMRLAIAAICCGSIAFLIKQNAAPLGIATTLALLLSSDQFRKRWLVLIAVCIAITASSLLIIYTDQNARFWTIEVLAKHRIFPNKIEQYFFGQILPICLFLLCLSVLEKRIKIILIYLIFLLVGILPTILPFIKAMGAGNNFSVFSNFLYTVTSVYIVLAIFRRSTYNNEHYIGNTHKTSLLLLLFLLLCLMVHPRAMPPKDVEQLYANLVTEIEQHHSAGKTILLSNTTTPYIDAGLLQPMRHRSNSELEIQQGGFDTLYSSAGAFAAKEYDIVIVNAVGWYNKETQQAIKDNYHEIKRFDKLSPPTKNYQPSLLDAPFVVLESN